MNYIVSLAKKAVEEYISGGKIIIPPKPVPRLLNRRAGVFVTIENHGRLRGCIGTYRPTKENLAREIIDNAISAAVNDYRFAGIKKDELGDLTYTVYVLSLPEEISDKSGLNPARYGVIVKGAISNRTGLLLPGLDGINKIDEQVSIAVQKAGIDLKNEDIILYRFTVDKYTD